jgi:uncharacterized radical SAM superfamily protein
VNAVRLCIDLFCRGVKIDPSCELEADARGIRRTRAGLGSGLELIVPGRRKDHWINVPVTESFVAATPWTLRKQGRGREGSYFVTDARSGEVLPVRVPPEPAWYAKRTSSGREMADIGVLQGTYLGIYVGKVCAFWAGQGRDACGFCTTGRNVGDEEVLEKSVDDVVETALAAKAESGITFVHLNTGYSGDATLDAMEPYIKALKERVGCLVGVQATPAKDLSRYDRLKALGVDHLSFCYEFQDPETFRRWCPGKDRALGQEAYFRALEHTSKLFGRGACSGEIIAGVEPLAWTMKAVDWIASVGAFPTVCIFRPTIGARMQDLPSPDPGEMAVVFREVWEACLRHKVPVGLAPNIEVSLIIQPDEARELVEDPSLADLAWRATLAIAKVATKPVFARRMRRRPVSTN